MEPRPLSTTTVGASYSVCRNGEAVREIWRDSGVLAIRAFALLGARVLLQIVLPLGGLQAGPL